MKTYTFGNGKRKILIVHGWMHSSERYKRLAHDLKEAYTVVLVDLPGFADTPPPTSQPILESYKSDIIALINAEKFDLIIGHSTGGAVLIRALHDPALAYENHVILANPVYQGIPSKRAVAYFWRFNQLLFFIQKKAPLFIIRPIIKFIARISIRSKDLIDDQLVIDCRRADPYTAAKLGRELAFDRFRWTTDRKLKSVTLFMSEFDRVVSNRNLYALQEAIGSCRLIYFEGIGHTTATEDYPRFLRETKNVMNHNAEKPL